MKKGIILFLFLLLMVSGICFADGFEIGVTGFVNLYEGDSLYGGGLNIAEIINFTNHFGLGFYGNIVYVPYEGIVLLPIDVLLGPAISVVNNDSFALPIALGFYMQNTFAFGDGGSARAFTIGVGGNISAEIKFSSNMLFYLRFQGAYTLLGSNEIVIAPSIGIGFH
jgi:hypothetical protein